MFYLMFFCAYALLTVVIIMFLFSTLHLLNPQLFNFKKIDVISVSIIAAIFFISAKLFLKTFKISLFYFRRIISRDNNYSVR
ncbi:MAG: hypothetical protein HY758_06790 [Nitrospirae bacterium]|nr:hypothetical protein [Nitrospirota bacterium]